MRREAVEDGVKEGFVDVSENGLLIRDVCSIFEKECESESLLRVCGNEEREATGADSLVEK